MKHKEINLETIKNALKDFEKEKPKDRTVKIITWQGGYELFCEAMRKEFEKESK